MMLINLAETPARRLRVLESENRELRAEVAALRARLARLDKGEHPEHPGWNRDGTMRCPYADIPGEVACDNHDGSGCMWAHN